MNPGEYPQPLDRVTVLQHPVLSGYTTMRMRADDERFVSQDGGADDRQFSVTAENTGITSFGFKIVQAEGIADDDVRTEILASTVLVPGGKKQVVLSPHQKYLEIIGTQDTGELALRITGPVRYNKMSWADDDEQYPQQITQNHPRPEALTLS